MPIYEYLCDACNHSLEKLQKMSDDPLTLCPTCGEESLKKQISAVGFRLKGTGWYETDFKSTKKKSNVDNSKTKEKKTEAQVEPQPKESKTKKN